MNKEMKTLTFGDVTYEVVDEKAREGINKHEAELLKAFVKVTTEPSPFHHITDSANMKVVDFGMEGITEQNTVAGNQLFDISKVTNFSDPSHMRSITNNGDGTLTIYSALTANNAYSNQKLKDFAPNLVAGETYTLNATSTGSSKFIYLISAKMSWKFGVSLEITQDMLDSVVAWYTDSDTNTPATVTISDIMINLGTTALPYEEYVGGMPSPNPDYKQPITLAGVLNEETGRYEHTLFAINKNFANTDCKFRSSGGNVTNTVLKELTESDKGYVNALFPVIGGQKYKVTWKGTTQEARWFWFDREPIPLVTYAIGGGYGGDYLDVLTAPDNAKYLYVAWSCNTDIYIPTECQVELGEVGTVYTPHASKPFTLTSPVPLTKWDNLVKVDGKWYWDYKQLPLVFDGTRQWYVYGSGKDGGFRMTGLDFTGARRDGYCNQLAVSTHTVATQTNMLWIGIDNTNLYVLRSSFYDDTLEDKGLANWKAHLNEHPLEIVTYKDESELVPLLDEEQELLRNLEMYYGVTNIYNEQGCPMWFKYCADQELHWNQKLEQINNALLSLGANV